MWGGGADSGAALLLPGSPRTCIPTVTMHAVNRPFCASPATRPVLGSPVVLPSWQCTFDIGERPRDPPAQPNPTQTPLAAQSGPPKLVGRVFVVSGLSVAVCRLKDDASREQLHPYGIFRGQIAPGRF